MLRGFFIKAIIKEINFSKREKNYKTIDVAGGTGDIAFRIAKKAQEKNLNYQIEVVDINPQMLEVGRSRAVDLNLFSRLNFVENDGEKLNFPDESFDVIICTEVFEHDIQYDKTIANIIRMLKTGGIFVFTCAAPDRPEHGTRRTSPWHAKLLEEVSEEWSDYYKNLTEVDFKNAFDIEEMFSIHKFEFHDHPGDLHFCGLKK